jgi:hypothetical protein
MPNEVAGGCLLVAQLRHLGRPFMQHPEDLLVAERWRPPRWSRFGAPIRQVFPNDASIIRLIAAVLVEQNEW